MKLPETYLIEKKRPDWEIILSILTRDGKDTVNRVQYTELAKWASTNLQKTGAIQLDNLELSHKDEVIKLGLPKYSDQLWGMINALIQLKNKYYKVLNGEKEAKIIQQTAFEILKSLKAKAETKGLKTPEEDTKLYAGMDWTAEKARRLAEAKPGEATSDILNKFYDDYYSVEYAGVVSPDKDTNGIVAKLKSLNKVLILEFNKLGYNPDANPFAQFLKIVIEKKKQGIFEKLTINTYGALHNSFISKYITGNMLGNYDDKNIIFCNDLYNHSGLAMVEYLSLQKQVIDAAEKNAKYSDVDNLIAKVFIQQNAIGKTYEEKIKNIMELDKVILPGEADAKIKSELEIQELYKYLFKMVPKKEVTLKVAKEILARAREKDVVLSMIRYILDQNEFNSSGSKYAEFAQETEEWLDSIGYIREDDKVALSKRILADYIIDAAAENSIVRHLREYAEEEILKSTETEE